MDNFALQRIIHRIPLLKFRYLGSFPSDCVPTLDNDTFAIINTQPSNMQAEQWTMIANFQHELYFADSRGCKGYSFLNNQHYVLSLNSTENVRKFSAKNQTKNILSFHRVDNIARPYRQQEPKEREKSST